MQTSENNEVWARIRDFTIDDPAASVKYSDKLAHYNGWSKEYTARVVEEYKKFIFLCYILPRGASPSKPIDEAWHLHLTYTKNYWKELCQDILGTEIHHYPSRGGDDDKEMQLKWYEDTLRAYLQIFQEEAPADIWLRPTAAPKITASPKIPAEVINGYFKWYTIYAYILLIPFLLIGLFYGKFNPYALAGPQFLFFFSMMMSAAIVYLLLVNNKKKKEVAVLAATFYNDDADIYQQARFIYGRERSLRAAVVDLAERNLLIPKEKGSFTFNVPDGKYAINEDNPLLIHLLRNIKDKQQIDYRVLSNYYDEEATYHEGLAGLYKAVSKKDMLPLCVIAIVIVVAIARIIQGILNSYPVTYLTILCLLFLFIGIVIHSSSSGRTILRQLFKSNYKKQPGTQLPGSLYSEFLCFHGPHLPAGSQRLLSFKKYIQ